MPAEIPQILASALELHQTGHQQSAEIKYRELLAIQPEHAQALHLLGLLLCDLGQHDEALESIQHALSLDQQSALYHAGLGFVQHASGDFQQASISCARSIDINPDYAHGYFNLGNALVELHRVDEAIDAYQNAIRFKSDLQQAYVHLSLCYKDNCYKKSQKTVLWIDHLAKALAIFPDNIALRKDYASAYLHIGDYKKAIKLLKSAIKLAPQDADLRNDIGIAYSEINAVDKAKHAFKEAIRLNPHSFQAYTNLAGILQDQQKRLDAIGMYRKALEIKPDSAETLIQLQHQKNRVCLWGETDDICNNALEKIAQSPQAVSAFAFFSLGSTAQQQWLCAKKNAAKLSTGLEPFHHTIPSPRPSPRPSPSDHKAKIKLGYISEDFRQHPVANLVVELFEKCDRELFEVFAYSYSRNDNSAIRQRIIKAVDHFVDIKPYSHQQAAQCIYDDGIDILIDLGGYTGNSRPAILALKPAPIQVNYLGFPGTMGARFMDYILVDSFIVPAYQQPCFSEQLVHLPHCYMPHDSKSPVPNYSANKNKLSRSHFGLPEEGFVFCSFSNSYKITATLFDIWMELLRDVPDSVLWLAQTSAYCAKNLNKEAETRGIEVKRLIYAPRLDSYKEHLIRYRIADLVLDTFPFNGHATTSDVLWAGCPLVTCVGETFNSRVAGSLLQAMDMAELATYSLQEYQQLALRLAHNPQQLANIRQQIESNRLTSPLFDGENFRQSFAEAMQNIWHVYCQGLPTKGLAITLDTVGKRKSA